MKKMLFMMAMLLMAFTSPASNQSASNSSTTSADVPAADEWLNKRLVFKTNVYLGDEYEAEIIIYEKKGHFYKACFSFYSEGDANDETKCGWQFAGFMTGFVENGSLILIIPDGFDFIGGCISDENDFMIGDFIRVEKDGSQYKGIPLGHGRNSIDAPSVNITVSPKPQDFEVPNWATESYSVREAD